MIKLTTPHRGQDSFGSGAFHAGRGKRIHQGVDFLATAGSQVHAILDGKVTKLGYTYADDLSYRYIEVTDKHDHKLRYYYVLPSVELGALIKADDIIGEVQNLDYRYKGMPNHIHFEIKNPTGDAERIEPLEYIRIALNVMA